MFLSHFEGTRREKNTNISHLAPEWEKITGAKEVSRASCIVSDEVWVKSTNIPNRFISWIVSWPKFVKPWFLTGSVPSSDTAESPLKDYWLVNSNAPILCIN